MKTWPPLLICLACAGCAAEEVNKKRGGPGVEASEGWVEPWESNSGQVDFARCPDPEGYSPAAVETSEHGLDIAVYYPQRTGVRRQLLVFLHGQGGLPKNNIRILGTAAYAGYNTLGLWHWNEPGVQSMCLGRVDYDSCVEGVRAARVYGSEYDSEIEFPDSLSVVGSLYTRLRELDELYPNLDWGEYYDPMPPNARDHENYIHWDRIVLGGFSAGAGPAVLLGRDQAAAGVVLHSGLLDPLEWAHEGETPITSFFAFRHEDEGNGAFLADSWENLGIPGQDTYIGAAQTHLSALDFRDLDTHRFVSTLPPRVGCEASDPAHGSMAQMTCMNIDEAAIDEPYGLFRAYLYAYCQAGS